MAERGAEHRLPSRGILARRRLRATVGLAGTRAIQANNSLLFLAEAEPGAAAPPEKWTQSTGAFEKCARVLR